MDYINSEILQVGNLCLKICISLNTKSKLNGILPPVTSYNNGKSCNYKITSGLSIEIKSYTEEWNKKNSIYIFADEIIYVLSLLKRVYYLITHERTVIFGIDDGVVFLKDKKANILSHVFKAGGDMTVTPYPITRKEDTREVKLFGIRIALNNLFIFTELDDYQLATVIDTLEKLDLFMYSNMILSNTLTLLKLGMNKVSQSINVPDNRQNKMTDSHVIKKESDEDFFKLK